MTDIRACEVCGKVAELIVRSSPLAPVSFGYCKECSVNGLEPYMSLVGTVMSVGTMDDLHEEAYEYILRNLKEQDISIEQFMQDVRETDEKFNEWCEMQYKA